MDRKTVAGYWRSGGDLEGRREEGASGFARHDGVVRAKSLLPGITKRAVYEFPLDTSGEDLPCHGVFSRCCRAHAIQFGAAARREAHPRFETPPGRQLQFDWKEAWPTWRAPCSRASRRRRSCWATRRRRTLWNRLAAFRVDCLGRSSA